jgi:hypothetical protein
MEYLESALVILPIVLVALTQIAAAFGRPKIVDKVQVVSKIFNLLVGNYGKARNKDD